MSLFILLIIKNTIFGALAAVGFAVLFNAPKRSLLGVAICGALGVITKAILIKFGIGIELSTFAGAICVGLLGLFFYKTYYMPMAIFSVSGAIPLVPGVYAFKAMMGIIALSSEAQNLALLVDIAGNFTKTAIILTAIAAGIAAPTLFFKRFRMIM